MSRVYRKPLGLLLGAVTLASLTSGCALFKFQNPLFPSAQVYAQPATPGETQVLLTYQTSQTLYTATATEAGIQISTFPNDSTPGVTFNACSTEYFDQDGQPIPPIFIPKQNFSISAYLAPSTATQPSTITLTLPVYNQSVKLYGIQNAFNNNGGGNVELNPSFSTVISCHLTLYGQDDNYNQITLTTDVPIRFDANITQ